MTGRRLLRVAEVVGAAALVAALALPALRVWRPVAVAGGSMEPALMPGDLVLVRRSDRPRAGDVVLVEAKARGLVLHRVVRVRPDGSLTTRGDANPICDFDASAPADLVGVQRAVIPVGKLIAKWRILMRGDTLRSQSHTAGR